MDSARDHPKGGVAPFGDPGINDRSHLPRAYRSVPRPSSPLSAKASTRCPFHTQSLLSRFCLRRNGLLSRHSQGQDPVNDATPRVKTLFTSKTAARSFQLTAISCQLNRDEAAASVTLSLHPVKEPAHSR